MHDSMYLFKTCERQSKPIYGFKIRIVITLWGWEVVAGKDSGTWGVSEMLLMFYFSIWVLVTRMCLPCENKLSCTPPIYIAVSIASDARGKRGWWQTSSLVATMGKPKAHSMHKKVVQSDKGGLWKYWSDNDQLSEI